MQILNIKKGFTLVEVLCSITIFNLIFMTIFTISICNFKLRSYNNKLYDYTVFMEELKNNIKHEVKFQEILQINNSKKYYIKSENIKPGILKEKSLNYICITDKPLNKPYIELNIKDGKVIKINVKFYLNSTINNEYMECDFYRGKYKKQ